MLLGRVDVVVSRHEGWKDSTFICLHSLQLHSDEDCRLVKDGFHFFMIVIFEYQ